MSKVALANIKKSIEISTRKEFEGAFKKAFNIKEKTSVTSGFRSGLLNASVHIFSRSMLRRYYSEFLGVRITDTKEIDILFDKYKSLAEASGMYITNDIIFTLKKDRFIGNQYAKKSLLNFISGRPNTPNAIKYISDSKISSADNFEALKTKVMNKVKPGKEFSDTVNSYIKAGLDLGHIHSNVEYFANIATVSGIAESDILDVKAIYKNVQQIPKEVLEAHFNAVLSESNSELNDTIRKNLFEEIYSSQMRLLRKFSSKNEFSSLLSFNLTKSGSLRKITENEIKKIINKAGIRVGIQNADINRKEGREILAYYRNNLPRFYEAIQNALVSDISKLDLLNISGSKTGKELIKEKLINDLIGNSKTPKSQDTKVISNSISTALLKGRKNTLPKQGIKSSATKSSPPKLRTPKGQFTSLTSLEGLMRAGLQQTLLKNMQRPNLRERTGRFRKSVKLDSVSRARDGSITAFLSYMRHPYGTFEPGGKQGNKGYSPTRLIDQSVRELASKLVKERMRVVVQ